MNLQELARGLKIFSGLSAAELDDILYRLNGVKRQYRKGEIVAHAGMDANRLLAVVSGHLHVYTETEGNHQVLVRKIGKDEVLGLWLLHLPAITCWPGTVIAAENSTLISLDMEAARNLLQSYSPTVAKLSANTSNILAHELFSTWRKLMVMDAPTIETRVMTYLTELDNESGGTGNVVVPFDRERMAEFLGVTRPALSRAIGHMRDQGLFTWRKNVFHLSKEGAIKRP